MTGQPLAVVPSLREFGRPDLAWMKKNVPIIAVAKALGLRVQRRKAKCWRSENHAHGDRDPSLSFKESTNRARCFVCDMRHGHSNVDLVIGVLGCDMGTAVRWIAERFTVPNVKAGRPIGGTVTVQPHRFGVSGSDWEIIVCSGAWGLMTPAERSVLMVLDSFKDAESGVTRMSYAAIMRYGGIRRRASVSAAIKSLKRLHAVQVSHGQRIGITRECSSYRLTLTDPKFLETCNQVFAAAREEVAAEREYRAQQKADRERGGHSLRVVKGSRPSTSNSSDHQRDNPSTCKGLNLSSPTELDANLSVPPGNQEIEVSASRPFGAPRSPEECKRILRERGLL